MPAWQILGRGDRLELVGELRLGDATAIWDHLRLRQPPSTIDVSRVTAIDGTVMALVAEITRGVPNELVGATPEIAELAHLYLGAGPHVPPLARELAIARLGDATRRFSHAIGDAVRFAGDLAIAMVSVARRHQSGNAASIPALVERAGADGVPIVVLLNFLVGFVGAFQSTQQLREFGANIYVADIVGVSVTRELAPLITAIIISGRSGAAFAAELGTMRVSEEIDALRTMGIEPLPYLVLPRVVALALIAPVLTLFGDLCGVFGGLVVGVVSLDVTARAYITELQTMVVASDVWTGLVKSALFGIAIALIGCRQGLTVRGAAAGVGRATTATVVESLFTIILLDTIATVIFREFRL